MKTIIPCPPPVLTYRQRVLAKPVDERLLAPDETHDETRPDLQELLRELVPVEVLERRTT